VTAWCLIHGSGQGPAGWRLLVEELHRRRHRTLTPAFQLSRADEGAAWHAQRIVETLVDSGEDPVDVVCVAHSAGGLYLPLVAERWRPSRMVFLAAIVPRPGVSAVEQFQADPSMFNPAWLGQNPMDDRVALDFVFHDCPADRIAWALSTRVHFYAKRAMEEPCPLSAWPSVPASYVACAADRTLTPEWQCRTAREFLAVEPVVLPGGHAPHVSRPEELADALEELGAC
jgi:pimeloyl-ACP methyl ester carboxylesterase